MMREHIRSTAIISLCFLLMLIQRSRGQTPVEGRGNLRLCVTLDEVGGGDGALNEILGNAGYPEIANDFESRLAVGINLTVRPARMRCSIGMEYTMFPGTSGSSQLTGLSASLLCGVPLSIGERLSVNGVAGVGFGNGSVNLTAGKGYKTLREQLADTMVTPRTLTFESFNLIVGAGMDYMIPCDVGLDLTVGLRGRMNVLQIIHPWLNGRSVALPSGTRLPAYQLGLAFGWRMVL